MANKKVKNQTMLVFVTVFKRKSLYQFFLLLKIKPAGVGLLLS